MRKHKWLLIFIICLVICLAAVTCLLVAAVLNFGSVKDGVLSLARYAFSDFGQVIYFTLSPNPYTAAFRTMYTPLNFLFYMPFALICAWNPVFRQLGTLCPDDYNYAIVQTWEFWLSLILYFAVIFTALYFVVRKRIPVERTSDKVFFFLSMLFSTFVAFGFIRGSNVFIALVFFMLYLNMYKSETRWKRETALACFAVAGIMKFYLLFGGILLIKESRWVDVIKCVVYALICLFLPFVAYMNPWETAVSYIHNMFSFVAGEGRIGSITNISAYNLVYLFFSLFHIENSIVITVICWVVTVGALLGGILLCLLSKDRFTDLIIMGCVFSLVAVVSYLYVLCFMIPAFLEFMRIRRAMPAFRRIFYTIIFTGLMFTPIMVVHEFWIYSILLVAAFIVEAVHVHKENRTPEPLYY